MKVWRSLVSDLPSVKLEVLISPCVPRCNRVNSSPKRPNRVLHADVDRTLGTVSPLKTSFVEDNR